MIIQKEQFAGCMQKYEKYIITICFSFTKNYFDAEDLAQETFLSAYRHLESFRGGNFKAWLTAIAAKAAATIMQLVQARDGQGGQAAEITFTPAEIETLRTLIPQLEGKTELQKNHHPPGSLAWAAWAIAKLGGWDGYPKSKPPGPITFRHGLQYFKSLAHGWALRDV